MLNRIENLVSQMEKRTRKKKEEIKVEDKQYISSSHNLLNLALTDSTESAFELGTMINIVGDSSSGKSFLCCSLLAELCYNKTFDNYNLIYGNAENGIKFNTQKLFGNNYSERVVLNPLNSVEDFETELYKLFKKNEPFIYILDSFDALTSEKEEKVREENIQARMNDKQEKGSYAMSKNKSYHAIMKGLCNKLETTKSLIFVISQTRDNISAISFATKRRNGERALEFYSSYVIWLAVKEKLKKTVNGKKYLTGVRTIVKPTKNRNNGKLREVPMTIKYAFGIDDLQDCIDYLISEKVFVKSGQKIKYEPWNFEGTEQKLIEYIEQMNLINDVKLMAQKTWNEIEYKIVSEYENRKPKFPRG